MALNATGISGLKVKVSEESCDLNPLFLGPCIPADSQNSVSNTAFASTLRDAVKFSMMSCVAGSAGSRTDRQTDGHELESPLNPGVRLIDRKNTSSEEVRLRLLVVDRSARHAQGS